MEIWVRRATAGKKGGKDSKTSSESEEGIVGSRSWRVEAGELQRRKEPRSLIAQGRERKLVNDQRWGDEEDRAPGKRGVQVWGRSSLLKEHDDTQGIL